MLSIRFITESHRPNAQVTLRTNADWGKDLPGLYSGDGWSFEVEPTAAQRAGGLQFKFLLDRRHWMVGENLEAPRLEGELAYAEGADVRFPEGPHRIVEQPAVARRLLGAATHDGERFDVIVVGSGMGGGVLADQLSDAGLRVLVLEAGGYLFPTHVANLPRRHVFGAFDKHVWALWRDFRVREVMPVPGYDGGQSYSLGGRSVFWGGLIPRAAAWELDAWPRPVRDSLLGGGYEAAEALMNAQPLPESPLSKEVRQRLEVRLPGYEHRPASLAVQQPNSALLAAGMFSTADLLLESLLTGGPAGNRDLTVVLNAVAVRLELDGARVTGVVAHDLIAQRDRTYLADTVVLAAGTIGSARLARASGVTVPSGLVGVGVTDHPIFFTHFQLPAGSPLATHEDSVKLVTRHREASSAAHPYLAVLEVGADLNQGRYVDDDLLQRRQQGSVLGEAVFLLNAALVDDNRLLDVPADPLQPATMRMSPVPVAPGLLAEVAAVKNAMVEELGAVPLPGSGPALPLVQAPMGGVAHEVGTMRMGTGAQGVVDGDLRLVGAENLFVCDLSVFPTSPAANPSLTLVALAIRLAEHLRDP